MARAIGWLRASVGPDARNQIRRSTRQQQTKKTPRQRQRASPHRNDRSVRALAGQAPRLRRAATRLRGLTARRDRSKFAFRAANPSVIPAIAVEIAEP
jgi:hypothetical protein